jgi:signal transduction histidine kinase
MLDERLRGAGVEVVRSYGAVPDMLLDYVRMGEVFTNLVTNAMDAMPRGGRLHVECRTEAGELVVKVSDTGAGIPPEVLDSVFLPFVTTKGAMSGSDLPGRGLALCVCQGVVAGHNGTISVESEPGQGAVFTIRLPVERPIDGLVAEGPLGPELVAEGPVESAEGT